MTYQQNLPKAFPWLFQSTRASIRFMVRQLVGAVPREDAPNGSSFAVTTDAPDGQWNLWLSEASKNYLVEHMPHMVRNLIPVQELMSGDD